jgi:hypothetical protein
LVRNKTEGATALPTRTDVVRLEEKVTAV